MFDKLTELNLENLQTVGGFLEIGPNDNLTNLNLEKLQTVSGDLTIKSSQLINLNSLSNLTSINNLIIKDNPLLSDINGLSNLTSLNEFTIENNNLCIRDYQTITPTNLKIFKNKYTNASFYYLKGSAIRHNNKGIIVRDEDITCITHDNIKWTLYPIRDGYHIKLVAVNNNTNEKKRYSLDTIKHAYTNEKISFENNNPFISGTDYKYRRFGYDLERISEGTRIHFGGYGTVQNIDKNNNTITIKKGRMTPFTKRIDEIYYVPNKPLKYTIKTNGRWEPL